MTSSEAHSKKHGGLPRHSEISPIPTQRASSHLTV